MRIARKTRKSFGITNRERVGGKMCGDGGSGLAFFFLISRQSVPIDGGVKYGRAKPGNPHAEVFRRFVALV